MVVMSNSVTGEETIDYSNFSSVITGEGQWVPAGFPLSQPAVS